MPDKIITHGQSAPAGIDTTTQPEDMADQRDGGWSKRHLLAFLARQPKTLVIVPLESYEQERPDVEHFQVVGYQGHFFHLRKGMAEEVPIQIAEVIKYSQERFPTQQSQNKKTQITDIRSLPPGPFGIQGAEVVLSR